MSESVEMKILNQIYNLVVDLQNVERPINSIYTGIRRRAYSLEEMIRDKELEDEKSIIRDEITALKLQLAGLLEDDSQVQELKNEILEQYQNAENKEKRARKGIYFEIINSAIDIAKKKRRIAEKRSEHSKTNGARIGFGDKYSKKMDREDR